MTAPEIDEALLRVAERVFDAVEGLAPPSGALVIARALNAERLSATALQREKDAKKAEAAHLSKMAKTDGTAALWHHAGLHIAAAIREP